MLEMRKSCEKCNKAFTDQSTDAMICSHECTFCQDCAEKTLMLFVQTAEVNFKSVPPENKHLFADSIDTPLSNNPNIHISLIYDNLTEMEKGFIQLAKGGKITSR